MQSGGLTPMEALHCATLTSAEAIGLQQDLGSLEAGKLADLIVLNANPLDDIRNTAKIAFVMKGGTLWNGDTLDEVWPQERKLEPLAWERNEFWTK
jgi:imidazolonepropionase-like amidohydrolase